MSHFIRTSQAEEDLLSIWEYIADDSRKNANAVLKTIDERCALLAQHPQLGSARYDLAEDLRYTPVGSYLILYRRLANGVEIVRVLHGARNLEAIFHGDE
jgi:toxin ParE1/3/4